MAKKIKFIQAVRENHGGLESATDDQVLLIWHSLGAETQAKYLNKTKIKEPKNATGNQSQSALHD